MRTLDMLERLPTRIMVFEFLLSVCLLHLSCNKPASEWEDDVTLYGITEKNITIAIDPKSYTNVFNWDDYLYVTAGAYIAYQEDQVVFEGTVPALYLGGYALEYYIGDYGFYVAAGCVRKCHSDLPGFELDISSPSYEEKGNVRTFRNFTSEIENISILGIPASERTVSVPGVGLLEVTNKEQYWEASGEIRFYFKTYKILEDPCKDARYYSKMKDKNKYDTIIVMRFDKMKYYKILPKDLYKVNVYKIRDDEGRIKSLEEVSEERRVLYKARKSLMEKGCLSEEEMQEKLIKEGKMSPEQRLGSDLPILKLPSKYD